jgi:hypothetical protein
MNKPNQTLRASVNVLDEAQLEQVVGGNRHCGGYRKNYNHRYEKRRYNDCYSYDGGYESKGSESSYDNYDSSNEYDNYNEYDHCDRKYS